MTKDTDSTPALAMPALDYDYRVVLEHTVGPMAGIHSICGLKSELDGAALPEFCDAVDMIDAPSMRTPGPVSLVAVKRRHVLYRQITTPEMQNGKTFSKEQR